VLILHGSPQSSRAVTAFAQAVTAAGLCAITPDTPGNGLSTPLQGEPSCADYADALAAFADALGLGRVALYGFHTGAAIACVFAARHPARVSATLFNGLSAWTDAERADLLAHYLPPFVPSWDGAHMAWAWGRVEEHTVFFPWHKATPETRMVYDVPSVAATHLNALDLLESGDGYRAPYAAAFGFRTEDWLARVACPALIAATMLDPLRPHLDRPVFRGVIPHIAEDGAALAARAITHLIEHPGDIAPPSPPSGADGDGIARGWIGGMAWSGRLTGDGRPLVLLHPAGGSHRVFDTILGGVARERPVIAFDLPGHGASTAEYDGDPMAASTYVTMLAAAIKQLGLDHPAIAGMGFGARLAGLLADRGVASAAGALGRQGSDDDAPVALAAPSLAPQWDGGHLLRAFRIARWERLFDPWHRRDRAHAKPQGDLDPADIQIRALDLLLADGAWAAAVTAERGAKLRAPISLAPAETPADWLKALSNFARD
jgi:pimeloyl-ACP methyl ester carboxylesterase